MSGRSDRPLFLRLVLPLLSLHYHLKIPRYEASPFRLPSHVSLRLN